MELTLAQAKEYLASLGITLPDAVLQLLVNSANSANECLDESYSNDTAALIRLYLIGLLGIANGDRFISSQTAPSGASQSFRYRDFADRWRATLGLLRALDTKGCTDGVVPPDPTQKAFAGLWVAKGGDMCGGA